MELENRGVRSAHPKPKPPTEEEEELDPRIHLELEKLNTSTDQINKLEKELEETNEQFRVFLSDKAGGLEKLMRKVGSSTIDKARPFYFAKEEADELSKNLFEAAVQFQRANDVHQDARKSVQQAESRYNTKDAHFDGACQEVLNHLTIQVNVAEKQKSESEVRHRIISERFFEAEKKVHELEKLLQKDIVKSKPYFDMKNSLNLTLNDLKCRTMKLQSSITEAKRAYSLALYNLEMISEEIHRSRSRTPGEGQEEQLENKLDE